MNNIAVIILAAGKGSRMKSDLAKVLHRIAGKSMINHVIEAATDVAPGHIHVVVGHQAEKVKKEISSTYHVQFAFQKMLIGTGDAVKCALPGIDSCIEHILVLCGDVPLIKGQTLTALVSSHRERMADLTVLAAKVNTPKGYGRIIQDVHGRLLAIREEADATDLEKQVDIVNSGIFCFKKQFLESGMERIKNNNNQGEYYLTDLVEIAVQENVRTLVKITDDANQIIGINTIEQLNRINSAFHKAPNPNSSPDFITT